MGPNFVSLTFTVLVTNNEVDNIREIINSTVLVGNSRIC